uniref:Uncharacterized protein n=2 Tax=Oryza meridionalis TaxID=40149 RepID=A0A0E0D7S5_9ORYZ
MSATPSAAILTISDVEAAAPPVGRLSHSPLPMEMTRRSSTPAARGNSRLLLSTWVMAAAVGLPSARPPPTAAMRVAPSEDRTSTADAEPSDPAHVAAHTSRRRKSYAAVSTASAREKRNGPADASTGRTVSRSVRSPNTFRNAAPGRRNSARMPPPPPPPPDHPRRRLLMRNASASSAENIGRPSPPRATSIAASTPPAPEPAATSKKSASLAVSSPVRRRSDASKLTSAAPASSPSAACPPPSIDSTHTLPRSTAAAGPLAGLSFGHNL